MKDWPYINYFLYNCSMDWDQSDSDGIPSYESEEEDFHQADFNHEGSERLNSKPISY